uniref:Uncharacterized protein n=1 Tax=Strongyloides venezuelensis TaxID=75913 RepID=A0A0K0FFQ0_STRVS
MSFKFHTALHGPHVLKNTGHFSNINCFGFEHHHQFLKKIESQFRGDYNYSKSLLSKVCLAQEHKISKNNFEEAIELYDKIFKNYEYIEPQSIVSNKTISLNQSYEKEKLFPFEEPPEDRIRVAEKNLNDSKEKVELKGQRLMKEIACRKAAPPTFYHYPSENEENKKNGERKCEKKKGKKRRNEEGEKIEKKR